MTVKTSRQARFARLRAQARSAARRAGGGGGRAAGPNFTHYFTVQQGKVTVHLLQK